MNINLQTYLAQSPNPRLFNPIPDRQDIFSQVARRVKGHRRSVFRLQTIFSRGQDERQNLRLSILRFGV